MMVLVLLLLLVGTTHALSEGTNGTYSKAQCIERERHALLSLKEGIVDHSNLLSSWTSSRRDCCMWRGIRCDNLTNHIIMLDLRPNISFAHVGFIEWDPFLGEIGSSLVELKYLRHLDLSYNGFTTIPKFIGALNRLRYLNLAENPITGTIPSQLGNLTKLRFLDLSNYYSYSSLTANTFEWISRLRSLRNFSLSHASFTNAQDWFHSFKTAPSLSSLKLTFCEFPVGVAAPSLSHINSSTSLTTLDVRGGMIYPSTVRLLLNLSSNLVSLTIKRGDIGGPLPKSLGNLCNLRHLDLEGNKFNGTLDDFLESRRASCSEDTLQTLLMRTNELEGSFPDVETIPTTLTELDISSNKLNGTLPESIGQLSNLEQLRVSSNSFTGNVSERHLRRLSKLTTLDLSLNPITMKIHFNWVPPFQLQFLILQSCKLGPEFPSWIQYQSNLSYLEMSDSGIRDIPSWFFNLTSNLYFLDISHNLINSTLPNFHLRSDNYPSVDLSANLFHGPIPPSLFNASVLNLSNNTLTSLGPFLCTLSNGEIEILDLSNNYLTGSLPDCWSHLKNLAFLNLENNKLSGVIPSSLASLVSIEALLLSHNNFSGNLPSSLKDCTQLEVLDVGKNNLGGEIPAWIGERLAKLNILQLKSNSFHGGIPLSLCHLQSIKILDLSQNHISGFIPSCLNNFTFMVENEDTADILDIPVNYRYGHSAARTYDTNAVILWKGNEHQYDKTLGLLRVIDLSSNRLIGELPVELTKLVELIQLNLSRNSLSGAIPEDIGNLSKLESLDLSHNNLSGKIPTGLAKIFYLDYLDLSHNHLTGRIPTSTQMQSFNDSSFVGNLGLCGPPLSSTCPGDGTVEDPPDSDVDEKCSQCYQEWIDMSWFYMGTGVGFFFGYLGVCGSLFLKSSWRVSFFRLMNKLGDWLYVMVAIKWARLKRRFSI